MSQTVPSSGLALGLSLPLLFAGLGCDETAPIPGPHVLFEPGGDFWDLPFPNEHRRRADGIRLGGFPNPDAIDLPLDLRRLIERDADGFGVSSTIYFRTTEALSPSALPDLAGSMVEGATAFLVDVDQSSPERGRRFPLRVAALPDPGPFGAPNLVALQPLQGAPLREQTLYAAVLARSARTVSGETLGVPRATRQLLAGDAPPGLSESAAARHAEAVAALAALGVDLDTVAGLTAFETGAPSKAWDRFLAAAEPHRPRFDQVAFEPREVFPGFCVFQAEVQMPSFQRGEPPFAEREGGWNLDAAAPEPVRFEPSRVFLTVPRTAAPQAGFPTAVFIRTGGGGDRPLVDRGLRGVAGGPALEPGTGPALEFARAGVAGITWDGPHGGLRNPRNGDEQFLVFNFVNPEALRDNLRQSALEAVLLADGLGEITVTSTTCGTVRLDASRRALMGHSMGASIAPLALSSGRFDTLLLSGAGGSWIENVILKQSPVPVRPLAELLLDYDDRNRTLNRFDPVLALLQWAGEPADAPVYLRRLGEQDELPHILMMQGIVDTYILPEIANATSLAAGLDLGGTNLEPTLTEGFDLLKSGQVRALPVRGNRAAGTKTRVVTQHEQGPIEDGHEVVFQTEVPKAQYRCFLRAFAAGEIPEVPDASGCSR